MKHFFIALLLIVFNNQSFAASDFDNIKACVSTVKHFTGISLDGFSAKFKGNWVDYSIAEWKNVKDTKIQATHLIKHINISIFTMLCHKI